MTSPKNRLLKNKAKADKLAELLVDPQIEDALEIAFAHYCWALPNAESPAQSWNANCKRQGAAEFMAIFLSIASESHSPAPARAPKLNPIT